MWLLTLVSYTGKTVKNKRTNADFVHTAGHWVVQKPESSYH